MHHRPQAIRGARGAANVGLHQAWQIFNDRTCPNRNVESRTQVLSDAADLPSRALVPRSLVVDALSERGTLEGWPTARHLARGSITTVVANRSCVSNTGFGPALGWSGGNGTGLAAGGVMDLRLSANTVTLGPAEAAIGLGGPGATFGGFTLPFAFAAAGLPSAPGCRWGVDPLTVEPLQTVGSYGFVPSPPLQLPPAAGLLSLDTYVQALAFDNAFHR
ncbi:MAG: hypothetical protein IPM29_06185 [Planctomycetes bacterium]|nr:hypothetical protein [Planctomycetota bacterium]